MWSDETWKIARRCGAKPMSKLKCTKHYTTCSDHFWKLRCRKSARRCGAKHISKSKCTKHTMLGPLLEVEKSKKCTPLWREARFQVKMYKTHHARTTCGSWDVEKVHVVVARSTCPSQKCQKLRVLSLVWRSDVEKVHADVTRSTFPSQNVQSTPFPDHFWKLRCRKSARHCGAKHMSKSKCTKHYTTCSDHFWKLRCRKSARRCGAKHISKSKCTKHTMLGPLLEVEKSKKCTPLCRKAHFQVKIYKAHHSRTTFGSCDVEKVHGIVARSTCPSQKCQKLRVLSLVWRSDVEKVHTK